MISLKKIFEADDESEPSAPKKPKTPTKKKPVGIEKTSKKQEHPNKPVQKQEKPNPPAEKKPEPKPATMSAQQAGGGSAQTAGTADIQKINKQGAPGQAPAMGGAPEQAGPQNPNMIDPAAHMVGKPVIIQQLAKIIPPELDRHGFMKTIIPGEIIQLCTPTEFATFVKNPESLEEPEETEMAPMGEAYEVIKTDKPIERDMVVSWDEIESVLHEFHIGKNIKLSDTEFSTKRTVTIPWPNMNDTVLVIIRLAPNAEGQIVGQQNGDLIERPEGPEARCTNVSKLLCPRQSLGTLHCIYVVDLEERVDADGPLPPIREDHGEIDDDAIPKNPVFDKYMNGPLRQSTQRSTKLKDAVPKNIKNDKSL